MLVILLIGVLFSTGVGPVTAVLLMGGKSSWNLFNTVVSLGVNVALNLILIPRLGINGAAIAWATTIVLNNLLPLLQVHFFMKLQPFSRGYFVVAFASTTLFGGLGLLTRLTLGMPIPTFLLFGAVASGLYLAVLWRFRRLLRLPSLKDAVRSRGGRRQG